ncbi:MAG: peptidylprolyl isomerase [Desulfobacterota bacterium]|nr:peptidylprolyl isomerase [Thermodesulfobacteriota bacterium]
MMIMFSLLSTGVYAGENPKVILETSMGSITLELYPGKAPATVKNFLAYVDEKFYDTTVFHRVIRGFMIQGGGMTADMKEKPTHAPIKNEADNGLKNDRGTISMARTPDPDSATAQFFINAKDNSFLNFRAKTMDGYGYCVFGKVTKGMDVVDAIEAVATGSKGFHQDVPVKPVVILKAYRLKEKKGESS